MDMEKLGACTVVRIIHITSYIMASSYALGQDGFAHHETSKNMFRDNEVIRDEGHIQEHLEGEATVDMSKMSPQEVEFHYFNIHDLDSSGHLDGLEIMKALEHSLYHSEGLDEDPDLSDPSTESGRKVLQSVHRHVVMMVDNILADDDTDGDGYLSYTEFSKGRRSSSLTSSWWSP